MALISMKNAPPKKETALAEADGDYDDSAPAYPWGLQINLCADDLAKLGITDMPALGSKLTLTAVVEVTDTSANERLNRDGSVDESKNMGLQITDMELQPGGETKDAASTLYG